MICRLLMTILFVSTFTYAHSQEVLTNKDVVSMVTAKVSQDLVLTKIKTSECQFDLTPDGLVELKAARVSDKLVKTMFEAVPPKTPLTNEDIVKLHEAEVSRTIILEAIKKTPGKYDVSVDGLVKLANAKVPDALVKEMMKVPVGSTLAVTAKNNGSDVLPAKVKSDEKSNEKPINCQPLADHTDQMTKETFKLYGTTLYANTADYFLFGSDIKDLSAISFLVGLKNKKLTALLQAEKTNDKEDTGIINSLLIKKGAKLGLSIGNETVIITALRDSEVVRKKQLSSHVMFVMTEFSITSKDVDILARGKVKEYRIPFAQGTFAGNLKDKRATQLMEQINCFKTGK